MSRTRTLLTYAAAAGAATLLAACGAGSSPSHPRAAVPAHAGSVRSPAAPTSAAPPAAATPTVGVAASADGPILVDARGRPLYVFTADHPGQAACNAPCLATWPLVPATAMPVDPPGVTAALGALVRPDGARQLTVDGSPAYTFTQDVTAGSPAGEGHRLDPGTFELLAPTGAPIAPPAPVVGPRQTVPPPPPAALPVPRRTVPPPVLTRPPTPVPAPVQQGNGGDHDSDNRGGPNDGDGGI